MSEDKDDLYRRKSDDELRAAGIDPGYIIWGADDHPPDGPFRLYVHAGDIGAEILRFGIVNLATGTLSGDEWPRRDEWTARLWCRVMNEGWVAGHTDADNQYREDVKRRTPRSTNKYLNEPLWLGDRLARGDGVIFTEHNYGRHMAIGFEFQGRGRQAFVVSKEAAVRVARAILARWPEPIEDDHEPPPIGVIPFRPSQDQQDESPPTSA